MTATWSPAPWASPWILNILAGHCPTPCVGPSPSGKEQEGEAGASECAGAEDRAGTRTAAERGAAVWGVLHGPRGGRSQEPTGLQSRTPGFSEAGLIFVGEGSFVFVSGEINFFF